jgi:rhamnosyltransferase subunit B
VQTKITGFPFYDGRHQKPLPTELLKFLDAGPPPIVFTLGSSAVWVARDFFEESIDAAQKLGRRAVLLIGDERNRPQKSLPAEILAVDYAPFESLLEHACVVVHHGGVGTTSQALRAGVPTLIVPFAFDQSDNAAHAARLGTSRTLYRRAYQAERVARQLDNLLTKPQYAVNAKQVAAQLRSENGAVTAVNLIEEFLSDSECRERATENLTYASSD